MNVFGDILRKYMAHDITMEIMCGKYKLDNQTFGKKSLSTTLKEYEIIENILFERLIVLNPHKTSHKKK